MTRWLVTGAAGMLGRDLTALLAELYALRDEEEITLETASQLLLRLRERGLQRELASADGELRFVALSLQ